MASIPKFKVLVGFPPTLSVKGTPLLSQNRQFQYFNNPTFLFPVALATGATMLRDKGGHDVMWYDAIAEFMDWKAYDAMIESEKPDFFFFETKAPVVKKHWEAVHHLKQKFPTLKIGICGDHVSYKPKETMENCPVDFVVNGGYYDFAFYDLLESYKQDSKNPKIPQGVWYRKGGKIMDNGRDIFKYKLDDAPRKLSKRIQSHWKTFSLHYEWKGLLVGKVHFLFFTRDCNYYK